MGMAELDWLLDVQALVGVVSREVQHADGAAEDGDEACDRKDAQPGIDVGLAMEDLTHRVDVRATVSPRAYSKRPVN
jgi:hypothetical protein